MPLYNPIETKTRELKITGKYLLVPIGTEGNSKHLSIKVGNTLVHNPMAYLAYKPENVLWWGHLDMSDYIGKTATISYPAFPDDDPLKLFEISDKERDLLPLYSEPARPQFHHSQKRGWSNDTNGMMYYDGEYHLFFQSNPLNCSSPDWQYIYWGHSTSPDMVRWTQQAEALRPYGGDITNRHPSMAVRECFSGSGNVDLYNTAGWQKGKEKTMVVAFTDTGCGESIAYSTDRGQSWTYDKNNPIIHHGGRDPKPIWYEPGKHWVIAVFDGEDRGDRKTGDEKEGIAFFTSKDLHQWTFASKIYGFFECPELFELPVEGKPNTKRWVLFAADGRYFTGNFDGKRFTPDHKEKKKLFQRSVYAGQCFSNSPDGRAVYMGWATFPTEPGTSYNQHFTLPLHFTLHEEKDSDGNEIHRVHINPIKEVKAWEMKSSYAIVY